MPYFRYLNKCQPANSDKNVLYHHEMLLLDLAGIQYYFNHHLPLYKPFYIQTLSYMKKHHPDLLITRRGHLSVAALRACLDDYRTTVAHGHFLALHISRQARSWQNAETLDSSPLVPRMRLNFNDYESILGLDGNDE